MTDNDKTISDQLSDLRQLISTSFQLSNCARDLVLAANDGVQKSCVAASAASEALAAIITKLGFSTPAAEGAEATTASSRHGTKESRDALIRAGRARGLTHRRIAAELGITHSIVAGVLKREDPLAGADGTLRHEKVEGSEKVAPAVKDDLPFRLSAALALSERELVDVLLQNSPEFTSAREIVKATEISNEDVVSATVFRARSKGVPIESAKQSRNRGEDIPLTVSGWRIIQD